MEYKRRPSEVASAYHGARQKLQRIAVARDPPLSTYVTIDALGAF